MTNKNSFLIYHEWFEALQSLTDEELGKFMRGIDSYQATGKIPNFSPLLTMPFNFIKNQLDRDNLKYQEQLKKKSEAGKLGANARARNQAKKGTTKQTQAQPSTAKNEQAQPSTAKNTQAKQADNVDVDVDVNVDGDVNVDVNGDGDVYLNARPLGKFENIFLTNEELADLVNTFGENETQTAVEQMSAHIKATGKTFKSHYGRLINWCEENKLKQIAPIKPTKQDALMDAARRLGG
ncbi:MAG: DUF6291 domain-containing protein [Vampirovibrionia bacterium]